MVLTIRRQAIRLHVEQNGSVIDEIKPSVPCAPAIRYVRADHYLSSQQIPSALHLLQPLDDFTRGNLLGHPHPPAHHFDEPHCHGAQQLSACKIHHLPSFKPLHHHGVDFIGVKFLPLTPVSCPPTRAQNRRRASCGGSAQGESIDITDARQVCTLIKAGKIHQAQCVRGHRDFFDTGV